MKTRLGLFCALALTPVFGCGGSPDQFLGAYTFSRQDTVMLTKPTTSNPSPTTTTGTIVVASGTATTDKLTMTDSNNTGSPCDLTLDKVSALTVSLPAGQTCVFKGSNGDLLDVTLTSGTGSLAGTAPGSEATLNLAWDASGSSGIFAVAGSGTSVIGATPVSTQ